MLQPTLSNKIFETVCMLFLLFFKPTTKMTKSAEDYKETGNRCFQEHKYDEAIKWYGKAIELKPDPAYYTNRSLAYIKLKKWDAAADDCRHVLELDSRNIKVRRGDLFVNLFRVFSGQLLSWKDFLLSKSI